MRMSRQIRPISYLKANAAEIVCTLGDQGEPLIITQNGEAKAVVQDIDSYEQTQETLALLKILALGNQQIEAGEVQHAADIVAGLPNEQTLQRLSHHPHRGSYPDEFLDMGIREYRQVLSLPYRIIYRVIGESVYVFLIADGRRNIRTLPQRRLLR